MDRGQKQEMVASLNQTFRDANAVVVTHFLGLTAGEATDLRRQMSAAGATFRVTKNSLTRLALEGTPYQGLGALFDGPTAVALSKDPVAAAKASVGFAKTSDHLTILGGALGETMLDEAGVRALAALPSLDEVRARLAGMLSRPAAGVAAVLTAPAGQLARVFAAYGGERDAA
ncbi:MAG: 50S ribosomal protein L10 [Alphaproteobacteria bacterium]|jgi:large subunit ribosomal protein L10|nr:50S ribosomal protein L10 [Alphaproteobacteria bacterium]